MLPAFDQPGSRLISSIFGATSLIIALLFAVGQAPAIQDVARRQTAPGTSRFAAVNQSPVDCGPETYPRALLEEHVETGAPGWTHDGLFDDLWQISSWRSHSGAYSWYSPAPETIHDLSLYSPAVFLPEGESPLSLHYWGYRDFEAIATGCYDGALLEITSDNGLTWTQLTSQLLTDPYDALIKAENQNPLAGRLAWCGHPQDWLESIVALDEFAGQTVQFRFRVGTDNSLSREGWYLDDFLIQSCPSAYIAAMDSESYETGLPGEQVAHGIRLENLGLDDQYRFQILAGDWPTSLKTPAMVALLSGQVFTATVLVELPAAPGTQQIEDTFILEARSENNPGLVLQTASISELVVNPGLMLQSGQVALTGEPGDIIPHMFWLTNTGEIEDDFHLAVHGADWPTYVSPTSGLMRVGETRPIQVMVAVPTGPWRVVETVITDTFTLRAESGWSVQISAEASSATRAGLIAGLRLDGPSFLDVFADRSFERVFTIANLGNFADRYSLEWSGDWLAGSPLSQTPWILPNSQGELPVTISVPLQIQDGEMSSIGLTATSQLDSDKRGTILLTLQGWKRNFLPLIHQ